MAEFDLFYFFLNPNVGEMPGLGISAGNQIRRAARGRGDDRMIVLLHLVGSASMSDEKQKEIVEETARLYYETPGSVTSGLRAALEQVNQLFLEHNLRGARGGEQWIASMNAAVLRRGYLYLAQAGSLHSFILGAQVEHFYDPSSDGRGLGTNRNVAVRFYQAEIHSGDNLVMCAQPPASWSAEALAGSHQIPLDTLRRRLINQAAGNANAMVMRFQTGKGQARRLRLRENVPQPARPAEDAPQMAEPVQIPMPPAPAPAEAVREAPLVEEAISLPPEEGAVVEPPAAPKEITRTEVEEAISLPSTEKKVERPATPPRTPAKRGSKPVRKQIGRVWFGWQNLKQRTGNGFSRLVQRLLPNAAEGSPRLSAGWLLFIAVAVPLIVVGIATAVYMRNGLQQQHAYSLQVAQQKAAEAIAQSDPLMQRQGWGEVLTLLDEADQYGASDVSNQLRQQAYTEIDRLDNVTRVELLPFSGNNELKEAQFSNIVASDTEVYLLDAAGNRVERLLLVNQGTRFSLDAQFDCSAGRGTGMGGLVDIILFPNFEGYKSALLAVDTSGGLMVCISGQDARYRALPAPEAGFGRISALTYDQGILYVLDSSADHKMVWRYALAEKNREDEESTFAAPAAFFTEAVPDLESVIDVTMYDNQLYLLFQDGSVTQCIYDVYTGLAPDCRRTISYTDLRTGQSNLPFGFSGVKLAQVQVAPPPDASVYLLDAAGPGIYHFGLGLETLNRVLRPRLNTDYPLPDNPLTAFAITQGTPRMVILAFVNQVYYGSVSY